MWCDRPREQRREEGVAQKPEWIEWVLFYRRGRAGWVDASGAGSSVRHPGPRTWGLLCPFLVTAPSGPQLP